MGWRLWFRRKKQVLTDMCVRPASSGPFSGISRPKNLCCKQCGLFRQKLSIQADTAGEATSRGQGQMGGAASQRDKGCKERALHWAHTKLGMSLGIRCGHLLEAPTNWLGPVVCIIVQLSFRFSWSFLLGWTEALLSVEEGRQVFCFFPRGLEIGCRMGYGKE